MLVCVYLIPSRRRTVQDIASVVKLQLYGLNNCYELTASFHEA